jgi:hypothetical protein
MSNDAAGFASATDRMIASPRGAFDAGLRPDPFPDQAASLLPGLLAATRTGLTPASDDELTNHQPPLYEATSSSAGRTERAQWLPNADRLVGDPSFVPGCALFPTSYDNAGTRPGQPASKLMSV